MLLPDFLLPQHPLVMSNGQNKHIIMGLDTPYNPLLAMCKSSNINVYMESHIFIISMGFNARYLVFPKTSSLQQGLTWPDQFF